MHSATRTWSTRGKTLPL